MSRSKSVLLAAALVAGTSMIPQFSSAQGTDKSPLRFLSRTDPIDVTAGGKTVRYFRVTPGKPLKMEVSEPMELVLNVLPLLAPDAIPDVGDTVKLRVSVANHKSLSASVPIDPKRLTKLADGSTASAPKRLRLPIKAAGRITIQARSGRAAVTFSVRPAAKSVATGATGGTLGSVDGDQTDSGDTGDAGETVAEPVPDEGTAPDPTAGLPIVPMIRKRVERLSLGVKTGAIIPTGPVDAIYGAGIENVYFGAEIRYSLPFAQRRFGLSVEAGRYVLVDEEDLVGTDPFGGSVNDQVRVTHEVVPLIGDFVFKQPLGSKQAVFVGVGGGMALTAQTESVEFRPDVTTRSSQVAARARGGYEMKVGPGRLVLEGAYLHLLNETGTPFLGGAFGGLQYRFVF